MISLARSGVHVSYVTAATDLKLDGLETGVFVPRDQYESSNDAIG
jgi:hypothetical protein